jgi:hypothetical protein
VTDCVLIDANQGFLLWASTWVLQNSSMAVVAVAASMPPMAADQEAARAEADVSIRSRMAAAQSPVRAEMRTACTASGSSSERELLALIAAAAIEPVQRPRM